MWRIQGLHSLADSSRHTVMYELIGYTDYKNNEYDFLTHEYEHDALIEASSGGQIGKGEKNTSGYVGVHD